VGIPGPDGSSWMTWYLLRSGEERKEKKIRAENEKVCGCAKKTKT
jgi:hypothetical protein